jgi:hypothetical protein
LPHPIKLLTYIKTYQNISKHHKLRRSPMIPMIHYSSNYQKQVNET